MGPLGSQQGGQAMIRSLATAAALTIGLTGYAFAQDTAPGAPAGTKPVTPPPITDMAKTASKSMHPHMRMKMHKPMMHHKKPMAAPMAAPTDAPK
jgi:hypothetical protein